MVRTKNSDIQLTLVCGDVSKEDLAYIAGLFDGEGSIYMGVKGARCRIEFQITSSNRDVLDWVAIKIGGYVYQRHVKTKNQYILSYQPVYDLRIHNHSGVKRALVVLLPYLKIKKERVKYALLLLNKQRVKLGSIAHPKSYWDSLQVIIDEANKEAPPERMQYLEKYRQSVGG